MGILKRIAISLAVLIVVLGAAGYSTFWYMNRTPPQLKEPNYFSYYKNQDTTPVGKVGIFVTGLIMPEHFRMADFHNLALKQLQYIPWPIRNTASADRGVLLLDTEKFYEFKPFKPTNLMDVYGNTVDVDGESYMEKYEHGDVTWVPPNPNMHFDHGYFLYKGRQGGMPTQSQKLATKARIYYYGAGKGLVNGRIPHEAGERAIVEGGIAKIQAKYGDVPYRFVTAEDFGEARRQLRSLLDEGVDTIVMAAPRPIYSHHEEFNGSIKHTMHYIEEWEHEHNKQIKLIITPQLGDFPVLKEAYMNMLRDRLKTLPENASVKVLISIHGMAWDSVPHEAWIELAPKYVDGTIEAAKKVLSDEFKFSKTEVVKSQDHFADPHSDPKGKYLSTNKASWDGVKAGYDYVVNLPIEFFAENTDTLFSHAMFNFEGFPGYDIYQPIDYSDWSVPYTRTFKIEKTEVIYNGLPVGKYNAPIIEAYAQAIDTVLSKSMKPLNQVAEAGK
jgi:protoheme ferro-lyase